MKKLFSIFIMFGFLSITLAADHGMYTLTIKNIKADYSTVCDQVKQAIQSAGFRVLADREITTPDRVEKDQKNLCGYKGKLIFFYKR